MLSRQVSLLQQKPLSPFYKPENDHDPFVALYNWFPNLFVNQNGPICSGYFAYFKHRNKMESIGAGNLEKIATKMSMRNVTFSTLGCESKDLHLLPSANLYLNYTPGCFLPEQCWNPETPCQPIVDPYKGCNQIYLMYSVNLVFVKLVVVSM